MFRVTAYSMLKVVLLCIVLLSIYTFKHESTEFKGEVKQLENEIVDRRNVEGEKQQESRLSLGQSTPHLAFTVCGDRLIEAWNMFKSVILFTQSYLVIHIFTDNKIQGELHQQLESLPPDVRNNLLIKTYNVSFPDDLSCNNCKGIDWRTFFRPCATQRLFLADFLTDVDSVIYADIDTLFLAPVDELWSFLTKFNSTQIVAAVPVSDIPNSGLYRTKRQHIPIVGQTGINSGVLLLNLTRVRQSKWTTSMGEIVMEYEDRLTFGDQDMINIYLNRNPEQGYLLPCEWNFRRGSVCKCKNAQTNGASLLHGTSFSFMNNNNPPFKAVFSAFMQFVIGKDSIQKDLLRNIETKVGAMKSTPCGNQLHVYAHRIRQFINQ